MIKKLFTAVLFCCAAVLFAGKIYFTGDSEKNPLSYKCGEDIVFNISLVEDGKPISGVKISWKLFGEDGTRDKGVAVSDSAKPLTIKTKLAKPGFAYVEAIAIGEDEKQIKDSVPLCISAGADVYEIRQTVPEPKDFDAYWTKQKARLAAVPMDVKLTPVESKHKNVNCYMFEIKSVGDYPATGYISMPKNAKPGSLKAHVTLYGYGFGSIAKKDELAAKGMLSLSVSRHGLPQGKDKQFYEDQKKGPYNKFGFRNNQTPENCDFNMMILRDLRALQYLKTRPEWNKKDITVNGGSMGAFQSINLAALDSDINNVRVIVPWCANLGGVTAGRYGRFRGWRPDYTPALDYFDIVNQAKRIKCPVYISIGLGDRVCPASGQFAMFNAMNCDRELNAQQTSGHRKPSPGAKSYKISAKAK